MSYARSVAFCLALGAFPLAAQPLGAPFRVNTFLDDSQNLPAVSSSPAGGFVVVWEGGAEEPPPVPLSAHGVFGQRFAAAGTPLGPEFRVNTYTTSFQSAPAIACDPTGGFFVVWTSPQDGSYAAIVGQRFDASGAPAGPEFRVNTATAGPQRPPSVAALAPSGFVVVWSGAASGDSGYAVLGQRFDGGGAPVGTEFRVNTFTTGHQYNAAVAAGPGGGFVVAWQDSFQDGSYGGVFVRRFGAGGAPVGLELRANVATTERQIQPSVAAGADGSFVVAWSDWRDQSLLGGFAADDVWARRFDGSGVPLGPEFRVNTYSTSNQSKPRVAADAAGDVVIVWQNTGQTDVNAQRISASGDRLGTEFRVNTTTSFTQNSPAVASDSTGSFVVLFAEIALDGTGYNVFGQRFQHMGPGGDADGDGQTTVTDVLYLINHLFAGGPDAVGAADVNGDGKVDVTDVLYLINYLFAGGPPPK